MHHTEKELEEILASVGLPPSSQKVYRELLTHGATTARYLSEKLAITRPSTYDHLKLLMKKGLVVEKKQDNLAYFAAADVRHVGVILEDEIEKLTSQKALFTAMLPHLLKESKSVAPKIKFFEGKKGLAYLLHDILWYPKETVLTLWPYNEMLAILGEDVLVRFNEKRLRSRIHIKALWPDASKIKHSKDYIWDGKDDLTERKYTKKNIVFSMGYSIYGDKVSFISSEREVFGFIVQSKEFADLMRIQFSSLWELSK